MKILIVDDDQEIHEMLKVFFESMDHKISDAFNASEGVKQMVMFEPDVVFLDIRLPDKDGIDVLKEMKQINKDIQIIIVTGYKEAEKVIDAFRHGAVDCLLKPLNFDYIKNLLPQLKVKKSG